MQKKYFLNFLVFTILFTISSRAAIAQQIGIDQTLQSIIIKNDLKPLEKVTPKPIELRQLGARLFTGVELSGPQNIACVHCHHPRFGTADAIPFSIGEGGNGIATFRQQAMGGVTKRHSPHLINLGYDDIKFMFWDGRVHRSANGILTTPEAALNGKNPQLKNVVDTITSSLSAQAIFPIANKLEMMGETGNKIADAGSTVAAWSAVVKRLFEGSSSSDFIPLFKNAFPNVVDFNIGHVGEAIAAFIGGQFNLVDTPYDRYLKGDVNAMTESEKKGLIVFAGRGKCIKCHNGRHLSNFEFKTVGTPQLNSDQYKAPYDQGRYEVTGIKSDLFKFKTPTLRNISMTAPFMHNGVFNTLEEVIEHYNDPKLSLDSFSKDIIDLERYSDGFIVDQDIKRNKLRINLISIGEVRRGIKLTNSEKQDLLAFLKTGLLDMRLQPNR